MRAWFAVHDGGKILRTGRVPSDLVAAQAVHPGEVAVQISGGYAPPDLRVTAGRVCHDGVCVEGPPDAN